jgi:hypothetical protein
MKLLQTTISFMILISFLIGNNLLAQQTTEQEQFTTPESVITEIYQSVTFPPDTTPDWEKVKSLFIDEAVIVLRTSFTKMDVMDKQGFADLFTRDIEKYSMDKTGFQEKIIQKKMTVIGDVAHCFVLYEASIPNNPNPPQRGVDSFQLLKKEGRWRIVSIINEIPRPGVPIPEALKEKELE